MKVSISTECFSYKNFQSQILSRRGFFVGSVRQQSELCVAKYLNFSGGGEAWFTIAYWQ
ncbi:hypothetical protein LINPERPRIM_LOCUS32336 [Linum perenne]